MSRRLRWLERELARSYLERSRRVYLARHPQLALLAFDYVSVTVHTDGRKDDGELHYLTTRLSRFIAGRTVCDVGANVGNHSVAFAATAARVVALEPHPVTYQLLKLNCRHAPGIVPLNLAASDRSGSARAATPRLNHGETRITDGLREGETAVTFELVRIDDLEVLAAADVGLVKIDVEGHEEAVIRGAEQLLRRCRPLIVVEQNADVIANGTSATLELLRTLGYVHVSSLESGVRWRVPQWIPRSLRTPLRVAEVLLFGAPRRVVESRPVATLERRSYPMLLVSTEPL